MNTSALSLPLTKRESPVIWGVPSFDLKNYAEEGFCVLKNSVSIDQNKVLPLLEKLKTVRTPGRIDELNSSDIRSQFDIHHQCPELLDLCLSSHVFKTASHILGDDPLIYQTHVNFKLAGRGGAYDWHSDFSYWRDHDGMKEPRAISVVVPLAKHTRENGGLEILKGSHHWFYPTSLTKKSVWSLNEIQHGPEDDLGDQGLVPKKLLPFASEDLFFSQMEVNDALIMDANAWHYSGPNLSLHDRATLFVILVSKSTPFDPRLKGYRPPYITCRKQLPLSSFLKGNKR